MQRNQQVLARESRLALWLLAPAVVTTVLLLFLPLLYGALVSVFRSRAYEQRDYFVGFKNYLWLWSSGELPQALSITLIWTIGSIVGQGLIGVALAVMFMQKFPGRNLFRGLLLCGWVMPGVVVGIIWRWIYDPIGGALSEVVSWFGYTELDLLGQHSTALASCIVASIWRGIPFWLLMVTARLQAIPMELYDAAAIDGASGWQRFKQITLPQIRSMLLLCTVLSFIWTFNLFDLIYALTRGGPDISTTTIPLLIYEIGFKNGHLGEASAVSLVLFVLMAGGILVFARRSLMRQEET